MFRGLKPILHINIITHKNFRQHFFLALEIFRYIVSDNLYESSCLGKKMNGPFKNYF